MDNLLEKIIKDRQAEESSQLNAVKIVNDLFNELLERERDILTRRFGLHGQEAETLEQIGKLHKLTRERVRQIESSSLKKLKKLESLEKYLQVVKQTVNQLLHEHGGLMEQHFMLDILAMFCIDAKSSEVERETYKRHFDFVISKLLEDEVEKVEKSDHFSTFYKLKDKTINHLEEMVAELTAKISQAKDTLNIEQLLGVLKSLNSYVKHQDKVSQSGGADLTSVFKNEVFPEAGETINANKVLYSLIQAAKDVDRNKFGEWGLSSWPEVKPKKISDKIYLVLKQNGQPMHFTEIAEKINGAGFDHKKANAGTVHNELILDDRYILVDRGMYALKDWQK